MKSETKPMPGMTVESALDLIRAKSPRAMFAVVQHPVDYGRVSIVAVNIDAPMRKALTEVLTKWLQENALSPQGLSPAAPGRPSRS